MIKKQLDLDKVTPFEHANLNIDRLINDIPKDIWQAICLLTQSVSDKRGTSKTASPHTKNLRRLYLYCTILFSTDDRCSFPLHTFITDLIESQGGSSMLIKIMNHFGICASMDTLSRFIQNKVGKVDPLEYLDSEAFTLVSADNVDFLHSYARVFQGNQVSSWHGTSIQAVQPLPSLSDIRDYQTNSNSSSNTELLANSRSSSNIELLDNSHSSNNHNTDFINSNSSSSHLEPHNDFQSFSIPPVLQITSKSRNRFRTGTEAISRRPLQEDTTSTSTLLVNIQATQRQTSKT